MGLCYGDDGNAGVPSRGGIYYSGCLNWHSSYKQFGSSQLSVIIKLTKTPITSFLVVAMTWALLLPLGVETPPHTVDYSTQVVIPNPIHLETTHTLVLKMMTFEHRINRLR